MKRIIELSVIVFVGMVLLPSCKKSYTCTCTAGGFTTSETQKLKKSEAETWCATQNGNAAFVGGSCSLN